MTARVRTGYSFRSAVGTIDNVLARLQAVDASAALITDTASAFGWVKWSKAALKCGMRPVFGIELAVTEELVRQRDMIVDRWTFIAKDSLVPLHELIEMATHQFYYQPMLTIQQAWSRDDVWVVMGNRTDYASVPALDHVWLGLGPSLVKGQVKAALAAGHRPIAVSDNRYPAPTKEDRLLYETICGGRLNKVGLQVYPQWIMSDEEWSDDCELRFGQKFPDALDHRDTVLANSRAELRPAEMVHPARPMSLLEMCQRGAKELSCDLTRPEYDARLRRELKLIEDKNYEDYFYLVAEICQWARKNMIVGPARGSSCGSLVCYLLKITTVDPIPYGLIFERFIDVNRSDLPDIDIDFPEDRRREVFKHIADIYGNEKVARLGTVAFYQPRSALKEAAMAMDIPPWELGPVSDSIVERSSGDSRALQATEDTLKDTAAGREFVAKYPEIMIAAAMEGHPRHAGQHAAGIVITEHPIREYAALDMRLGAIMCDKKDAESLNLLKIDALGLTQLSIFEQTLEIANLDRNFLDTLTFDDPAAFQILNDKKYAGIFQFNGLALQSITDQINVNSLNDIVAITALARPGPLNTGGTNHWIKVRTGRERETYPHPLFEPHLKSTLGVVAYQEQVMNIGREIGGLSWEDVTALRKAMSKSLGKEFFDQYGDKWKAGAREKGIPEETLVKVWDDLCAYGSWAFNLSHALAYGIVSYYCCWLKAHYTLEFAAATLSYTDTPETQIKLLRELASEGISYLPVHIDSSTTKWTVVNGKHLVGPLNNVVGIGPKMMSDVISARHRGSPLPARAKKLLENPVTKIDSLYPITDAFKRLLPDPRARNIISEPRRIRDVQSNGSHQEVVVFCVVSDIKPKDENEGINVAKRGGKVLTGPTNALNLRLSDDTDTIFAKVSRWDFERLGRPIIEKGRAGKALYAVKGTVPKDFRMISVSSIKYIGDLNPKVEVQEEEND